MLFRSAGAIEVGEKVLAPLRSYGPPAADLFAPVPYNEAQRMADFLWPPGLQGYWKSSYMESLSNAAIDVVTDYFARVPSPHTVVVLEHYGDGAMSRVPESETAFGHRNWPYNFLVTSAWSDPAETDQNIAWTREFFDAMKPFLANASYINYIGDEGIEGLRGAACPAGRAPETAARGGTTGRTAPPYPVHGPADPADPPAGTPAGSGGPCRGTATRIQSIPTRSASTVAGIVGVLASRAQPWLG